MYRGIISVRGANENIKLTPFEKADEEILKIGEKRFREYYCR
jgi:hypothetical protein